MNLFRGKPPRIYHLMMIKKKGGIVFIMTTKMDFESLSLEDKEAIAEYYRKEFSPLIKLLSNYIAELKASDDDLGFMFLSDIVRALILRGCDHMCGDVPDQPRTIQGWPVQ